MRDVIRILSNIIMILPTLNAIIRRSIQSKSALPNSAIEADVALAALRTTQLNASRYAVRRPGC